MAQHQIYLFMAEIMTATLMLAEKERLTSPQARFELKSTTQIKSTTSCLQLITKTRLNVHLTGQSLARIVTIRTFCLQSKSKPRNVQAHQCLINKVPNCAKKEILTLGEQSHRASILALKIYLSLKGRLTSTTKSMTQM